MTVSVVERCAAAHAQAVAELRSRLSRHARLNI